MTFEAFRNAATEPQVDRLTAIAEQLWALPWITQCREPGSDWRPCQCGPFATEQEALDSIAQNHVNVSDDALRTAGVQDIPRYRALEWRAYNLYATMSPGARQLVDDAVAYRSQQDTVQ